MKNIFTQVLLLIYFFSFTISGFGQNKNITGKVADINGNAILATIAVKHGNLVVLTDVNGKFSLSAPALAILEVSAPGYITQTISTTDAAALQIVMPEDIAKLDEVIVTGLTTTIKRRNSPNAVTTISAALLNEIAPAQTFDAAINGKIPGAFINANTGAPGGGVSVKLRGVTSIYGNTQPLYIIDGMFADNTATSGGLNFITKASLSTASITSNQDNQVNRIADIKPEDIDKIEILKGASAAAIYGSKAAAGVIIITTKKGNAGKTKISFSQDAGIIKASKLLGVRVFDANKAAGLSSDSATSALYRQQFLTAQAAGEIYDYEKEIFGNTGFGRNTAVSIRGGNEKTRFYFSAMQKDESGIVKYTGYKNSSFRLNADHQISKSIKVAINTSFISTSADRGLTGNDNTGVTLGIALSSTPSFAQLHADAQGKYPNNPFAGSNPLQTVALVKNNESNNRFLSGMSLDAILQKNKYSNTKLIFSGGLDFYNLITNAQFPSPLQFQAINKGTLIQGFTKNLASNIMLSLVNNYTPFSKIAFTTSAGITKENGNYNNLLDVATKLITGQSNITQGGSLTASQFISKFENTGIFIQEEANIMDAITLNIGSRFDRSTNNGNAGKFYFYPKAGLSLNVTKMNLLKTNFFDNIKFRAAYGQANNVPAYGSKFTSFVVSNTSGLAGSLIDIVQGNPGIRPERQSEFETGFDLAILKGKLSVEFTYYTKNIYDFLMLTNPPSSSGFLQKWLNAGDLRNRGVEIGINAQPVSTTALQWTTSVNYWFNRSLVTRLITPPVPQGSFGYSLGGSFRIEQGKPATQIVGVNGNGVGVLGDAEPDFQMTSYNQFTFCKKLTFSFLLHWKKGGDNINITSLTNDFGGTSADYDAITNPSGIANGLYRIKQYGKNSQLFIEDAGYLRFREIALYYTLKNTAHHFADAIKIGASLNNFFTITKYKSYDPEVSNFGTGFSTGVDLAPYPAEKRAFVHVTVEF
ncbi:SusC/RagA family TonB-linked outer membrane protein [Ferruginibacter sp. SUN106]|uniref:SusC/RagA family TonB-linked outer membrane protein n=1 Tax=Ferruginibacter sp. SUN106 TaxID=2978348 RepID=UPI003D361B81